MIIIIIIIMLMMKNTLKLFWLGEHGWVLLPYLRGSLLNPVLANDKNGEALLASL